MISASREDRTAAMKAVIDDILLGGHGHDFNPLAVSVERPRVPVVGADGETYWEEVGICRVVIEGAVEKNVAIRFDVEAEPDPVDGDDDDNTELRETPDGRLIRVKSEEGMLGLDSKDLDDYFGVPAPVLVEESDGNSTRAVHP